MRADDPGAKLTELLARPLVKICGLTRAEDVAAAAEADADLAGFVLAESPRRAEASLPVPETMLSVAVCVGEPADAGTDLVQLYPEEEGHRARNGVLLRDGETVAIVRDLPWLGRTPATGTRRRRSRAACSSPAGSAPKTSATPSRPSTPGPSMPAGVSSGRPGSRITGGSARSSSPPVPRRCGHERRRVRRLRRTVRPRDVDAGAGGARARLGGDPGRRELRGRARRAASDLRGPADAALPRGACRRRAPDLPETRGSLPHGRPQDQQRASGRR